MDRIVGRERPPKRLRKSKKMGCPSQIILRDLFVFPQFKVPLDSRLKRAAKLVSAKIKSQLDSGNVEGERRVYIDLPDPLGHVGHVLGQEIEILSQRKKRKLLAEERAMMDLTFLGTASCFPTPKRGVSSTVFRHDGECWMFDCGEGTQIQIMKSKLKASRITKIFITHLHGDHLFGLPGLLCTMSQDSSIKRIELYGPWGLRKYLRVSLELSRSMFDFTYVVHELIPSADDLPSDWEEWHPDHEADQQCHPQEEMGRSIEMDPEQGCWPLFEDKKLAVKAAPLVHRIPCFGYVIEEKTQVGKLKAGYLKERGIPPGPLYAKIKSGENIVSPSGEIITPIEAIGPSIQGRKIVILGDTKDSSQISRIAYDADILVHEATLNNELVEKCLEAGHSTPAMAAEFARSINAKSLVLFHVSQRFRPLNETAEDGEETVELLLRQATETNYTGQVVIAEDLDTITIHRKVEVLATEMDTEASMKS
ncbi:zinc phosphodiesterase ELAC protein 1-like isoform X2 [Acanthaster planci]|uniref:Zinc phosphodiesterase ELAC protein 1-like isoform X2 n=1 Tax=Acanthaster planci TaxID=133434 RepID=A0A8B7XPS2_ACAPL|nr:zinc phosphodiesterase ELAC protein 1-like isoform X2 [Acanthaster planci]